MVAGTSGVVLRCVVLVLMVVVVSGPGAAPSYCKEPCTYLSTSSRTSTSTYALLLAPLLVRLRKAVGLYVHPHYQALLR